MVRDLLRRMARRSYGLTKWRQLRRMERHHRGDPVVVFCMSKTASSAIVRAIREAVPQPVYKIHLLLPESVGRAEARYRDTDAGARPRHVFHASHLMRHLPTPEHPWSVVTIVREPVMRSVSDFFQSGDRLGRLHGSAATAALFQRFAIDQGIPRTIDWFDRELRPSLGIDVYEHPFDPSVGWSVIRTDAVRMLVLRQESLDAAPDALGRFLGLPGPLEIAPENVASDKAYSELYASVVDGLRLPADALDQAYGSRLARHFYSPAELAGFRNRWTHGSPGASDDGRDPDPG